MDSATELITVGLSVCFSLSVSPCRLRSINDNGLHIGSHIRTDILGVVCEGFNCRSFSSEDVWWCLIGL